MKTIARSNKYILALVLAVALVLTAIFGLLAVSHSKAASPASLEEKKAGWYAVRSGAVDLACNGVLQNKFGSWFVEDGKVNFSYTGWLVCEGTYYYVTQCNHSQGRNQFCEWHKLRFSDFQQRWQRLCF